eukprot:365458-Chlamydomonas_euryale.AAC.7
MTMHPSCPGDKDNKTRPWCPGDHARLGHCAARDSCAVRGVHLRRARADGRDGALLATHRRVAHLLHEDGRDGDTPNG